MGNSNDLANELLEKVNGHPIPEAIIALKKVYIGIIMQIPEPDKRLEFFDKLTSGARVLIEKLSAEEQGAEIINSLLGQKISSHTRNDNEPSEKA